MHPYPGGEPGDHHRVRVYAREELSIRGQLHYLGGLPDGGVTYGGRPGVPLSPRSAHRRQRWPNGEVSLRKY